MLAYTILTYATISYTHVQRVTSLLHSHEGVYIYIYIYRERESERCCLYTLMFMFCVLTLCLIPQYSHPLYSNASMPPQSPPSLAPFGVDFCRFWENDVPGKSDMHLMWFTEAKLRIPNFRSQSHNTFSLDLHQIYTTLKFACNRNILSRVSDSGAEYVI